MAGYHVVSVMLLCFLFYLMFTVFTIAACILKSPMEGLRRQPDNPN